MIIADRLGVSGTEIDGHASVPVAMSEGIALAIVQAVGREELLGGLGGFIGVALGLDAVVYVPRNQAPTNLGDAGKVAGRGAGGLGDGRGEDAGAGQSAEEDGGEEGSRMHCEGLCWWCKRFVSVDGCLDDLGVLLQRDLCEPNVSFPGLPLLDFIVAADQHRLKGDWQKYPITSSCADLGYALLGP